MSKAKLPEVLWRNNHTCASVWITVFHVNQRRNRKWRLWKCVSP